MLELSTMIRDEKRTIIESAVNHTIKTINNLFLLKDSAAFCNEYGITDTNTSLTNEDIETLLPLMFIHVFYKVVNPKGHAKRGADFISKKEHVNLLRFHDILGVIHTGEASLLFLKELIEYVESIPDFSRKSFLSLLRTMTIIDVASYGFLNRIISAVSKLH